LLKQTPSNSVFLELAPQAMHINNSTFSFENAVSFTSFPNFLGARLFYGIFKHTSTNGKDYRWLAGLTTAIVITRVLPKNMLQFKFYINYVPKLISTGTFSFFELVNENNGTLKHRINNIGFSVNFGMPKKNKNKN